MKAILAALSPRGLAQTSARRPWLTVALWALLLVAALVSASSLSFTEDQSIIGAESTTADDLLEDLRGPEPPTETVIVRSLDGATVDDGAFERRVDAIVEELRALGVTANVVSYYETRDETLVSQDRTILILPVVVTGTIQDAPDTVAPIVDIVEKNADASFETLTLGTGSMNREFIETYEKDLRTGEMIGIPAALIILLLVFGAAVAAGVPIVLSLVGIIAAVGITAVFSRFMGITSMSINMITMIGLAVGIDYSTMNSE